MTRAEWLVRMINEHGWKRGAEVGVKRGDTLFHLLERCPSLTMVGVDLWAPLPDLDRKFSYEDWDHDDNYRHCLRRLDEFPGRAVLVKAPSVKVAQVYTESGEEFDFVFIDACHTYDAVKQDIKWWVNLVRPGGMLIGHDINWPTVRQAVEESLPGYENVGHDRMWSYTIK